MHTIVKHQPFIIVLFGRLAGCCQDGNVCYVVFVRLYAVHVRNFTESICMRQIQKFQHNHPTTKVTETIFEKCVINLNYSIVRYKWTHSWYAKKWNESFEGKNNNNIIACVCIGMNNGQIVHPRQEKFGEEEIARFEKSNYSNVINYFHCLALLRKLVRTHEHKQTRIHTLTRVHVHAVYMEAFKRPWALISFHIHKWQHSCFRLNSYKFEDGGNDKRGKHYQTLGVFEIESNAYTTHTLNQSTCILWNNGNEGKRLKEQVLTHSYIHIHTKFLCNSCNFCTEQDTDKSVTKRSK